ncbi:hypothetical protein TEA_024204 [Camellia sinensis var. sinensis]|uniref:Uncharacterized protein n=1 Tax=Camellia sinensis var. sinensis TaxID=542762 RepID=A0A4S4DWA0_CAMSN|nr:hypothetical protein TEA_024204 [Camellia sinensis var. sinensis]
MRMKAVRVHNCIQKLHQRQFQVMQSSTSSTKFKNAIFNKQHQIQNGNFCSCLSTQPSLYEQECYTKPTFSSVNSRQSQGGYQKSSSELKTKSRRREPIITEPPTPTFPMPVEKITEKETEVTENELKLINDELEKFLEAEAKEVGDALSERSSHVSIITICGKQIEGEDTEEDGDMVVCPLQGYLFGSPIEVPETSTELKKERTTLGQLFKRTDMMYDNSTDKCEKGENHAKRTYATCFIKKMLKRLQFCSTGQAASAASSAAADAVSTKRKLPKVLRMLHKKVHPERSAAEKEYTKSHKYDVSKNSIDGGYNKGGLTLQKKINTRSPLRGMSKKEVTNWDLSHKSLSSSGLTQKKEHWIKTDADCMGVGWRLGLRALKQQKLKEVAISRYLFLSKNCYVVFSDVMCVGEYSASFES